MENVRDITGIRSGSLTAIRYTGQKKNYYAIWECKCDCGKTVFVKNFDITSGYKKFCDNSCPTRNSLIGQKFNYFTVIEESRLQGRRSWLCKCVCGKVVNLKTCTLKSGNTKSCGCMKTILLHNKSVKHNLAKHPLYIVWEGIKKRCYNEKSISYKYYGLKGIGMCDEWRKNPENFINWALSNNWHKGLTIDRINNYKDYSPANCRLVTIQEQQSNKTSNHMVTYKGKTQTVTQWANELGVRPSLLLSRINKYGWTEQDALERKIVKDHKTNCKKVMLDDTVFESIKACANYLNVSSTTISNYLYKNKGIYKGYKIKLLS